MEQKMFYKLVCVDESDPLEYKVIIDLNRSTLEDVHEYVKEHINQHTNAKWMLIPYMVHI